MCVYVKIPSISVHNWMYFNSEQSKPAWSKKGELLLSAERNKVHLDINDWENVNKQDITRLGSTAIYIVLDKSIIFLSLETKIQ